MSEHPEPPERVKEFTRRVVSLCHEFDAEIIATDDFGIQIKSGKESYGGNSDEMFYRITDEGIV